jgi:asparagine synthase (glutamine-hydrolysing)
MYLVCRLAREQVTVALSGDGGDELFSGYNRYAATQDLWRRVSRCPYRLRHLGAGLLGALPSQVLTAFDAMSRPLLKATMKPKRPTHLLQRIKELAGAADFHEFYGWANSRKLPPGGVVKGRDMIAPLFTDRVSWELDAWSDMSLLDLQTYLPDDILVKADRASMAVSLEARVPLLDHRVVEMAARLPVAMKVREGRGKHLLRQVLYRHVPQGLVDRPKQGFGIPLAEWLRGPLRDWAEDLLSEERLRRHDYLLHKPIRKAWRDHQSGRRDYRQFLWSVLVFQAWTERWQ